MTNENYSHISSHWYSFSGYRQCIEKGFVAFGRSCQSFSCRPKLECTFLRAIFVKYFKCSAKLHPPENAILQNWPRTCCGTVVNIIKLFEEEIYIFPKIRKLKKYVMENF